MVSASSLPFLSQQTGRGTGPAAAGRRPPPAPRRRLRRPRLRVAFDLRSLYRRTVIVGSTRADPQSLLVEGGCCPTQKKTRRWVPDRGVSHERAEEEKKSEMHNGSVEGDPHCSPGNSGSALPSQYQWGSNGSSFSQLASLHASRKPPDSGAAPPAAAVASEIHPLPSASRRRDLSAATACT